MSDKNKLIPTMTPEQLEKAELRDIVEHLYWQTLQTQVLQIEMEKEIESLSRKVERLNQALASTTYVRAVWGQVRYDFRTDEVVVSTLYRIDFSNTIQADLLRLMFIKKTGKPKKTKWQCTEVAEFFRGKEAQLDTARKVSKVAWRIRDKLRDTTTTDFLSVSSTEFFWFTTH